MASFLGAEAQEMVRRARRKEIIEKVNPVRKDGALTPPFLRGIEDLFILSPS
jgi:hypothetical protein